MNFQNYSNLLQHQIFMDSENENENNEQSQNLSLANTSIKGSFSLMKENKDSNIKELSQNLNNMNCSNG